MMKIIADEQIPYVKQAFRQFGDVVTLPGRSIKPADVSDADILLTRSVTQVNKMMLQGSSVGYVATATSGINHIDREYLQQQQIGFDYAAGSNARSVAEYVLSSLFILSNELNFKLQDKTVGIIGHGHVGSLVAALLRSLDVECLINDPPLQEQGSEVDFVSLQEALDVDIVTLHIPLVETGDYPTRNLISAEQLSQLKQGCILINTSRGEVIDEAALESLLLSGDLHAVIDVWQQEPDIRLELLKHVDLGTAHIAGYSYDAKLRATEMIYHACCKFYQQQAQWCVEDVLSEDRPRVCHERDTSDTYEFISKLMLQMYNTRKDDQFLRNSFSQDMPALYFDLLRKEYRKRREFPAFDIDIPSAKEKDISLLTSLGLNFQ